MPIDPIDTLIDLLLPTLIGRDNDDLERRWRMLQRWAPGNALADVSLQSWAQSRLVGTPAEVAQQLRRWGEAGVEQVGVCGQAAVQGAVDQLQLVEWVVLHAILLWVSCQSVR